MEKAIYVMFLFFVYSFVGWIVEVVFHVIEKGIFINRGFLKGPYCPIYGSGMVFVLYFLRSSLDNIFVVFIFSIVITTFIELVGGIVLEKFFSKRWWDYRDEKFNFHGYICPKFSFYWGIGALIVIKVIQPLVKNSFNYIPIKVELFVAVVMSVIMLIDLVSTTVSILGLNRELRELEKMEEKILSLSNLIGNKVTKQVLRSESEGKKLKERYSLLIKERDEKISELSLKHMRMIAAFPTMKDLNHKKIFTEMRKKVKEKMK